MKRLFASSELADNKGRETGHGVENAWWDNFGDGWRMQCVCGYVTDANKLMEDTGRDFDAHLISEGVLQ
jgi:hypothetical protein